MSTAASRITAEKIARSVAIVGTLLLVCLHVVFARQAGALWRDEVNSLEVATMPLAEMWSNMSFDSFPILFFIVLRCFAGVPAQVGDTELRIFGCAVGLLLVGVVWLNARWFRIGVPLVSLALIGFNPMIIRYGDSVRAYGLGMVLMLCNIGAMWRLIESCTKSRALFALVSALLSVHTLYYNSILLFAVSMGALAVTICVRSYRAAFVIVTIGAIAAISLIPYRSVVQGAQAANFMWKVDFTFAEFWRNLAETLGSHSQFALIGCIAAFAAGSVTAIWGLVRKESPACRSRLLFAGVALLTGIVGYSLFLFALSYRTRPWYYVVLIAFIATCLEIIFSAVHDKKRVMFGRVAFALVFIGSVAYPIFETLAYRQTNVDQVARIIEQHADPGDLIIINTWNYAISFQHYYHGTVPFETVPPLQSVRCHRVDLAKEQMMAKEPLAPLVQKVEKTLRGGKTIWLIGWLKSLPPGQAPLSLSPGYDTPTGWVGGDFYQAWSEQLAFLVRSRAERIVRVPIRVEQPVMFYENLLLHAISGWRDERLAITN